MWTICARVCGFAYADHKTTTRRRGRERVEQQNQDAILIRRDSIMLAGWIRVVFSWGDELYCLEYTRAKCTYLMSCHGFLLCKKNCLPLLILSKETLTLPQRIFLLFINIRRRRKELQDYTKENAPYTILCYKIRRVYTLS